MARPAANPFDAGLPARSTLNSRDTAVLDYVDEVGGGGPATVVTPSGTAGATYVGTAVSSLTSGDSCVVPRPVGASTGDLIVIRVSVFPETAALTTAHGNLSAAVAKTSHPSGGYATAVFTGIDDGTANYTFDTTGASSWREGFSYAWSGGGALEDSASVHSAGNDAGVTFPTVGAVASVSANALIVGVAALGTTRTPTWGGGYTGHGLAADKIQAVAGNATIPTLSLSDVSWSTGVLMAFATSGGAFTGRAIEPSDANAILRINESGDVDFTVPADPDGLEIGEAVNIAQLGTGSVTITPDGVTMRSEIDKTVARTLAGRGVVVTLLKTAADEYLLIGNLVAV